LIIIDDEKEISNGFARFFPWKEIGFTMAGQFSGAKSALQYIKKNPVDLVVSDVIMPGMTGIDLARELANTTLSPQPLLVLFSAYDEFEYVREALWYRCTDYILKSTQYEELITIFSRLKKRIDGERKDFSETEGTEGNDRIILLIKGYIKEHLREANLEAASALVFLSPAYVSRYFKKKTGLGFSEYLLEQKMAMAASLLLQLRYKIYDISFLLGYTNPVNFTRSFKKFHGVSPQEYRFKKLGRIHPNDAEASE
jgi:YesN/AraC family two-component response regulator